MTASRSATNISSASCARRFLSGTPYQAPPRSWRRLAHWNDAAGQVKWLAHFPKWPWSTVCFHQPGVRPSGVAKGAG